MLGATHVDLSLTVLQALGWKGDAKLAAKNAAYPDAVRSIEVQGVGCSLLGHCFAAWAHFERDGKYGYSWPSDRSIPDLDIIDRKVIPHPEAWGFPVPESFILREPLAVLVHDLTQPGHEGPIQADRITFPAASIMAEWVYEMYLVWAKDSASPRRREALDTLAGWLMHLAAQDPAVCFHADGLLLDGHSAFEGDVDEQWHRMKASGEIDRLLKTLIPADNAPDGLLPRALAESTATDAVVAPCRLKACRWLWRPGWNKLVRGCVLRGLLASVQLGKVLMRAESAL